VSDGGGPVGSGEPKEDAGDDVGNWCEMGVSESAPGGECGP
jgi:hypothetical protein